MTVQVLAALVLLGSFDPSPSPGAVHACEASILSMVPATCPDPNFPAEFIPCEVLAPPSAIVCAIVEGPIFEIWIDRNPAPGQALAFCVFAENSAGRSGCAVPILDARFTPSP